MKNVFLPITASMRTKQFQAAVTTGVFGRKHQSYDSEFTIAQFKSCIQHYYHPHRIGSIMILQTEYLK